MDGSISRFDLDRHSIRLGVEAVEVDAVGMLHPVRSAAIVQAAIAPVGGVQGNPDGGADRARPAPTAVDVRLDTGARAGRPVKPGSRCRFESISDERLHERYMRAGGQLRCQPRAGRLEVLADVGRRTAGRVTRRQAAHGRFGVALKFLHLPSGGKAAQDDEPVAVVAALDLGQRGSIGELRRCAGNAVGNRTLRRHRLHQARRRREWR